MSYVPSDRNTQGEKTYTAYGLAKFDFADAGFPLDGNIGVRVIKTKVSTDGFIVQTPRSSSTASRATAPSPTWRWGEFQLHQGAAEPEPALSLQ